MASRKSLVVLLCIVASCACAPTDDMISLQSLITSPNVSVSNPDFTFEDNLQIGVGLMAKKVPIAKLSSVHASKSCSTTELLPVESPEQLDKIDQTYYTPEEERWHLYSVPGNVGSWNKPVRRGVYWRGDAAGCFSLSDLKIHTREAMTIAKQTGKVDGGLTVLQISTEPAKVMQCLPPRYHLWFGRGYVMIDATNGKVLEIVPARARNWVSSR